MGELHYWLTAVQNGQTVLIYGGQNEDEARRKGFDKLQCEFEVVPLHTRNQAKASSIIRGRTLEDTSDLDRALRRQVHEPGLEQAEQRERRERRGNLDE